MNIDETTILKKMMESSIEEIKYAEKYIHLAEEVSEIPIAMKLQEIAKEELKHHEMFKQMLETKLGNSVEGKTMKSDLMEDVYEKWFSSVKERIEDFKAR